MPKPDRVSLAEFAWSRGSLLLLAIVAGWLLTIEATQLDMPMPSDSTVRARFAAQQPVYETVRASLVSMTASRLVVSADRIFIDGSCFVSISGQWREVGTSEVSGLHEIAGLAALSGDQLHETIQLLRENGIDSVEAERSNRRIAIRFPASRLFAFGKCKFIEFSGVLRSDRTNRHLEPAQLDSIPVAQRLGRRGWFIRHFH